MRSRTAVAAAAVAAAVALPTLAQGQNQPPGQEKKDDRTPPEVSVAASSTQLESRLLSRGLDIGVSCDEACTITAIVQQGGRVFRAGEAPVGSTTARMDEAGKRLVEITLNQRAREAIARSGNTTLVLRVRVVDAAGNRATVGDRLIRTQTLAQRLG